MVYQINVPNIHCTGCVGLIKMTLEEFLNHSNIVVDQKSKVVEFVDIQGIEQVKVLLDKGFVELKKHGYIYSDLRLKS